MREDRLAAACSSALSRLSSKEAPGLSPDIFAELGETLFWLYALAENKGKQQEPLLSGLAWARNRMTHGVLVTAPVVWDRGSILPHTLPMVLGQPPHHKWIERNKIDLGPKDRADRSLESAYDSQLVGLSVIDSLRQALALIG